MFDDIEALVHLVDVNHIAAHRVARVSSNLLPLHFIVAIVWMVLAHIVLPSGSTSGRTGHTVVDAVLKTHRAYLLQTVVRNDVIAKDVHILLNHRTQILHQVLAVLHEVGVDVVLQSTYSIIVLDESAAGGFLHHVQHVLTVAHSIEESGQRTQVLSTA